MQKIHFREAVLQDVDLIMKMEVEGFAPGNRERKEVYEQRIDVFPQGSLMAYVGSECVGCIFSEIWHYAPKPAVEYFALGHDISSRHDSVSGTELYVTSMTIAPPYRGLGLGAQLLSGCVRYVAQRFSQVTTVLLLVNETWGHARDIYVAAGFKEVVIFKNFFRPVEWCCEDGIVMRRSLSGFPE